MGEPWDLRGASGRHRVSGTRPFEADLPASATSPRLAWADNLKVALVAGVIVAHATGAWTGYDVWVFEEPPVREPLLTLLLLALLVGVLFGMALFFLVAGMFTPASLQRKGLRRFITDRAVRLLVPMLIFVVVMAPLIEYVDPSNVAWTGGFWAFVPHAWTRWPPVEGPGPTWFLGVLFVFSLGYAVVRTLRPRRTPDPMPPRARHLVAAAAVVAAASYLVRLVVPFGEEWIVLNAGQAPAWIVGFALGVLGGERGWFQPLEPRLARGVRRVAWASVAATVGTFGLIAAVGTDIDLFAGRGTWQSLVLAALEGAVMVTMSLWLVDLFRRRWNHRGRLAAELGRAAFAAFLVHQIILVGLVLATRLVPWPPEVEFLAVSVLGVTLSFGVAAALVRLPGIARVI